MLLGRMSPTVRTLTSLPAGMARMRMSVSDLFNAGYSVMDGLTQL